MECSYFNQGQCKSCSWIDLTYEDQIKQKELKITEKLHFFERLLLLPSVKSKTEGFRDRVKMVVTGSVEQPIIGLTGDVNEQETLDQGREILSCPIHRPELNEVIAALPEFIARFRLIPYQIAERTGELKGLILFYSPVSGEMYLRFVLRSKECVSRIIKLLPELQTKFPKLVCVTSNIQPVPHALLEGTEEIYITERKQIDHVIGADLGDGGRKISLKLSPQAFVQTNTEVATQLYQTAADWIQEAQEKANTGRATSDFKVLDLYCGQGAFSFVAAKTGASFLGIDINQAAIQTANEVAAQLKISNVRFTCLDASRFEDDLESRVSEFSADLFLVNPPRRGLGEGIKLIEKFLPSNLLYSSCNIETLGSDLEKISSRYKVQRVMLFDLFPHTPHFETLIWLTLK